MEDTKEEVATGGRVIVNPVNAEQLTPYNEEFLIDIIGDGEDIHLGYGFGVGNYWIRCDFSNFDALLAGVTNERLTTFYDRVNNLKDVVPNFDERTRELVHTCWRSAQKAQQILGTPDQENVRLDSFERYSNHQKPVDDCIKPLSKTIGQAACAEFAFLSKYILERLGVKSKVVVGAFRREGKELAVRHTYLVI